METAATATTRSKSQSSSRMEVSLSTQQPDLLLSRALLTNVYRNSEFANFYLKWRTFMHQRIVRKFNSCPFWCIYICIGYSRSRKQTKTVKNQRKSETRRLSFNVAGPTTLSLDSSLDLKRLRPPLFLFPVHPFSQAIHGRRRRRVSRA